jgi:hypothetical protein
MNWLRERLGWNRERVVTWFGTAALIRRPDRSYELRGGTADDEAAAREWVALFLHEAVLARRETPGRAVVTRCPRRCARPDSAG